MQLVAPPPEFACAPGPQYRHPEANVDALVVVEYVPKGHCILLEAPGQ